MIMKKSVSKEAFILNRGEYDQPTDKVVGHYPLFYLLYWGCVQCSTRSCSVVSLSDHPLTARVWVNRIWERLFGVYIV